MVIRKNEATMGCKWFMVCELWRSESWSQKHEGMLARRVNGSEGWISISPALLLDWKKETLVTAVLADPWGAENGRAQ